MVRAIAVGLIKKFGAGAMAATMIRAQATKANVVFLDDYSSIFYRHLAILPTILQAMFVGAVAS